MVTTPSPSPISELAAPATDATATTLASQPVEEAEEATPGASRRSRVLLGLAGTAVLAAMAITLWLLVPKKAPPIGAEDTQGNPVRLEQTARWDPAQAEPSELDRHLDPGRRPPPPPHDPNHQSQRPAAGPGGPPPGSPPPEAIDRDGQPRHGGPPPPPIRTSTEVFQPGVGVVSPVLVSLPPAVYPDGKSPKSEIVIMVEVLVDEHGRVLTATVKSGPSFKRKVKEAAIAAAREAVFRPAVRDGVHGRMRTEVRVVFSPE